MPPSLHIVASIISVLYVHPLPSFLADDQVWSSLSDAPSPLVVLSVSDAVASPRDPEDGPPKRFYAQVVVPADQPPSSLPQKPHSDPERKFNLIIHGLQESALKLHFQQVEEENASVLRLLR